MTSPLPPRLRDTKSFVDRIRQDRTNLGQLGVGFMGGRFPPLRPLGAPALLGDLEDDETTDETSTERMEAWNTDHVTATVDGTITLGLTFEPIDGSLLIFWNGLYQMPTDYSLSNQTVTFTNPAIRVGHTLAAAYWYWPSDAPNPVETLVDFGSDGWSYKQVSLSDSTDYSAADLDDSAWSVGQAAFGNGLGLGSPVSGWAQDTSLWLRRTITDVSDVTVTVKVEDNCKVYVNGILVGTAAPASPQETRPWYDDPFTVSVSDSVLDNGAAVVAIRCNDDTTTLPAPDNTYADVKITGRPT